MQENKDFANEIINHFGEDRFYHSCIQTSSLKETKKIFYWLNGPNADFEAKSQQLMLYLFKKQEDLKEEWNKSYFPSLCPLNLNFTMTEEEARVHMCRILFGICERKSFGLRIKDVPASLQVRMILGEKNEWVESYARLMQKD